MAKPTDAPGIVSAVPVSSPVAVGSPESRVYAGLLGALAFAFLLRVVGQILVVLDLAPFLPPMEEWYSGLLAYPYLLASQIIILALQVRISWDLWRGRGFFARQRPGFGRFLHWFGLIYLVVMIVRYILTMVWFPELRWFTGTIPIFFHWVLATYVLLWARYHRRVRPPSAAPSALAPLP